MPSLVVEPFVPAFAASDVADLHSRLDHARWPEQETCPLDDDAAEQKSPFSWGRGPSLELMKELARGWREFDFDAAQTRLRSFKHYKATIDGATVHFIHERSSRPNAFPLILCHGWPGGFFEFLHTIKGLTKPDDPAAPAFDVVIPSMPGYAWSSAPTTAKWTMQDTSRLYNELMLGLGYDKYAAQGGDWGSITARCLGSLHPEHCIAVHLNYCPVFPALTGESPQGLRSYYNWMPSFVLGAKRQRELENALAYLERGHAYDAMQMLTPRTPAYGLNDSPIGLLAWIGEKMLPGIDGAEGKPDATLTRDALFLAVSIYWFTGAIGTSFLPYTLNPNFLTYLSDPTFYLPNFALSSFPDEILLPTRRDAGKTGTLQWYKEAEEGGHFAALEQPQVFVEHLREAMDVLMAK
ncbi:epoxide hydrolase family protein [Rhodotorula paludigena]|uniref:epoxide hydrolase family protein n=1 Tax=Rhodotorula paludigena TaxID=86838 RepID=UPI00316B317E